MLADVVIPVNFFFSRHTETAETNVVLFLFVSDVTNI
jgi:hypothetical protein